MPLSGNLIKIISYINSSTYKTIYLLVIIMKAKNDYYTSYKVIIAPDKKSEISITFNIQMKKHFNSCTFTDHFSFKTVITDDELNINTELNQKLQYN